MNRSRLLLLCAVTLFATPMLSHAETRVTYKSAKSSSSYFQMGVQIAEAMKAGSDGGVIVTVEESQGSVQNVMEAAVRQGNYVFTTPPALIGLARGGKAMFEGKENPKFDDIRALFPIPSLTMHFVVSEASGISSFADLEGKSILLGKGSFGAKEGAKYLNLFGLEGKVDIAEVELSNAVSALKNGQIDAFVTAGSYPAPNVIEAAAGAGVKVLSLSDEQVTQTKRTRLVIPAGTYAGQTEDVVTTSLPVVAYSSLQMNDDDAYQMTKTFWEQQDAMAGNAAWWAAVSADMLANINTEIHPGAIRYYEELGVSLEEHPRHVGSIRRALYRVSYRSDIQWFDSQPHQSPVALGVSTALDFSLSRYQYFAAHYWCRVLRSWCWHLCLDRVPSVRVVGSIRVFVRSVSSGNGHCFITSHFRTRA